MSEYRHKKTVVPFHAIDNGLAASMHKEIKVLYSLLLDSMAINMGEKHGNTLAVTANCEAVIKERLNCE
tara:strand:- start:1514 stop:1720 length:207 start_codon:yes stop_codon:yes gene_type:complete